MFKSSVSCLHSEFVREVTEFSEIYLTPQKSLREQDFKNFSFVSPHLKLNDSTCPVKQCTEWEL